VYGLCSASGFPNRQLLGNRPFLIRFLGWVATRSEKSYVLQFITGDGSKISAQPSGTEPKIKFYVSVNGPLPRKEDFDGVMQKLQNKVQGIVRDMGLA
jgi:phosphomannomutase